MDLPADLALARPLDGLPWRRSRRRPPAAHLSDGADQHFAQIDDNSGQMFGQRPSLDPSRLRGCCGDLKPVCSFEQLAGGID